MSRYFIGLTVPDELAAAITAIRRQLGTVGEAAIKRCEPHLTLVMPFRLDRSTDTIVANLQITLRECNLKPFRLTTNGIGSFPSRVWYLGIVENKPLQALHQRLAVAIRELPDSQFAAEHRLIYTASSDTHPFRPHLTIVSRLDRNSFHWIGFLIDRASLPPTAWMVDAVALYRYKANHWERAQTIPFLG